MSRHATTLPHLMTMLPDLHPRHLVVTEGVTVKQLRLVSKEVDMLTRTAITSCTVHLGVGVNCLDQTQLFGMMAGAQLQQLNVTVDVSSGPGASTEQQQVSACMRQMLRFLVHIGRAIESVQTLTLVGVHHDGKLNSMHAGTDPSASHTDQQQQQQEQQQQQQDELQPIIQLQPIPTICPASLAVVFDSLFALLAAACPDLCKLNLRGCCWDASLQTFGACCPLLTCLYVEALHVPIQAVRKISQHLPNLTTIHIGSPNITPDDANPLNAYMDAFLRSIHQCPKLTTLLIEFLEDVELAPQPESWLLLPKTLKHFRCSCPVGPTDEFDQGLHDIPSLSLYAYPGSCDTLSQMFECFPALQKTEVINRCSIFLDCKLSGFGPGVTVFKDRLLDEGFLLVCYHLNVSGTSAQVRDVLSWMPILPYVQSVQFHFDDGVRVDCLEHLPRIFPDLRYLAIGALEAWSETWSLDAEFLAPVAKFTRLTSIMVEKPATLSVSGVRELCSSMGNGFSLSFGCWEGVDGNALVGEAKSLMPGIVVMESEYGQIKLKMG